MKTKRVTTLVWCPTGKCRLKGTAAVFRYRLSSFLSFLFFYFFLKTQQGLRDSLWGQQFRQLNTRHFHTRYTKESPHATKLFMMSSFGLSLVGPVRLLLLYHNLKTQVSVYIHSFCQLKEVFFLFAKVIANPKAKPF